MTPFEHPEFDNHERVVFCRDAQSDLFAIIALHNTSLGPAAGGCRMYPYASVNDALTDVLRLSRGMSYKNAMAGLALGGGKSVIIGDPQAAGKERKLEAFASAVQGLGGAYWTAIDVGVSVDDVAFMQKTTQYVFALRNDAAGRVDASNMTALGCYSSLKACLQHKLGRSDLKGLRVALQGCGKTGADLADRLSNEGAELIVTDVNDDAVHRVMKRTGATAVAPDAIFDQTCDVFVPCALGAIINDDTVPRLKAKIVCGTANNQLAEPRHGADLHNRHILYAPDYIVNAGGVIYGADDIFQTYDAARTQSQIEGLGKTLLTVFQRADAAGLRPELVADDMAKERIVAGAAVANDIGPRVAVR